LYITEESMCNIYRNLFIYHKVKHTTHKFCKK